MDDLSIMMKPQTVLIGVILLILGLITGYFIAITTVKPEVIVTGQPVVVFDMLGRQITFKEAPQRIVSLGPAITETLFALGLGEKVVGVDEYSNYPPELLEMKEKGDVLIVGGYWTPDPEKILACEPDLVIAEIKAHAKIREKLEELGLRVVFIKGGGASNVEEIYEDIGLISRIFALENKARSLIDDIKSKIQEKNSLLAERNASRVRVFALLSPPAWGLWTAGGDTYINDLIELSGGENIMSRYSGYGQASYEEVIEKDPEVIILTIMGEPEEARKIIHEIINSPLNATTAVKNMRIYVLIGEADDIFCRPGPRVTKAIEILSKIIHPEIFGAIQRPDVISAIEISG